MTLENCNKCQTKSTVFKSGELCRCLKCGADIIITEDDWNED